MTRAQHRQEMLEADIRAERRYNDLFRLWQSTEENAATEQKEAHARYEALLARYHEANGRVLGIAETLTAPKPVNVTAPAPDFQAFPPLVASALAVATAGFSKPDQRSMYEWTQAELLTKSPDEVAEALRRGLPVRLDPEELS